MSSTSSDSSSGSAGAGSAFVGHAMLVSGLTFFSRITGLVRDAVLAAVFGLSAVADAFFIGFLVPNLFRRLFGEGALSAAFIPWYSDLRRQDPELARRFAWLCIGLVTLLLCVITVAGELLLLGLLGSRQWSEAGELALRLAMVMLPYMPLVCLVALVSGVLHVHGRFGPPAAAPVVLNVVMIGAAMMVGWGAATEAEQVGVALAVAWSVLVAGLIQVLWQGAVLWRLIGFTRRVSGAGEALRGMLKLLLPMLGGLAVYQVNALTDSLIAFGLSPRGTEASHFQMLGLTLAYPIQTGGVGALQWAQRLYQFPLGVFGIALATAIFPALAYANAQWEGDGGRTYRQTLRRGLRLTVFIGLPASVGLFVMAEPIIRLIYERGAFGAADTVRVAGILGGYAAGVWAYSMMHVLTRAFYARKDAATPLKVSLAAVGLNLGLNLVLIWPLGAAGLAWSTAASVSVQVAALLVLLHRRVTPPLDAAVLRGWGRTLALSLVMGAALWWGLRWVDVFALGFTEMLGVVLGGVCVGVGIVFLGGWMMRMEEVGWVVRRKV